MKVIMEQWLLDKKEKIAIRFDGLVLTYHQLLILSCQVGNLFETNKANKVLFCLYNSPAVVICYLGAWLAGKVAIPVNPRLTNQELIKVIEQFKPDILVIEGYRATTDLLICCQNLSVKLYITINDGKYQGGFWQELLQQEDGFPEGYDLNAKTIHLTSGTTGRYKVVAHTLAQIEQYAQRRAQDFGYQGDDRMLIVTSLNHAFSFSYQLLPALILGLDVTLLPKFEPEKIYAIIEKNNITTTALLPIMCYQLSRYAFKQKKLNSLRYVIVAGDSVPYAFNVDFKRVFGVELYQGVGMTEVYGYAQNQIKENKTGSAGKILSGVKLRIIDHASKDVAPNQIGELILKTEMNLELYEDESAFTQQVIENGWLKTGDIGYMDDDGFLWFLGRSKQIIISGGSNVSPVEVEQALYQNSSIIEAGVVGKSDEFWGQVIWAYVCMVDGFKFDEVELIKFTQSQIAAYKCPKKIIHLSSLPKTSSGKIDRYQLKALAEKH